MRNFHLVRKMIKGLINEGKLVPSEMTVKLILNAMSKCSNNKILIDGFPRNDENREVWDRVVCYCVAVFFIYIQFFKTKLLVYFQDVCNKVSRFNIDY